MKANEVDILIVPGEADSDAEHWQSRWEAKLSTAKRVPRKDAGKPVFADWTKAIAETALSCAKPVILVAHGLGVPAAVCAALKLKGKICGGFFVSPSGWSNQNGKAKLQADFGLRPSAPLPFPSIVIASRNSPFSEFSTAEKLAEDWRSLFLDAGESGHIDAESGHGPWPEGLMVFSQFLASLPGPEADSAGGGKKNAETAAER